MSKVPISVCIIAKNEEKYIEECLRKLKPYGFEIVVADTGSTDATKEIASRYADKVVDFTWINDFSAARNFCAKQASNNWILALDCDEYIESVDIRILRVLLQQKPKQVGVVRMMNWDIVWMICPDYIIEIIIDMTNRFMSRLFRSRVIQIHWMVS